MIDRFTWNNSPELRNGVQEILTEWGNWSQGGQTNLGHSNHIPGTTPPEQAREARLMRATVDVDRAKHSEYVISCMCLATQPPISAKMLKMRYVNRLTDDRLAATYRREFGRNDPVKIVLARLDDAEWSFACLV